MKLEPFEKRFSRKVEDSHHESLARFVNELGVPH